MVLIIPSLYYFLTLVRFSCGQRRKRAQWWNLETEHSHKTIDMSENSKRVTVSKAFSANEPIQPHYFDDPNLSERRYSRFLDSLMSLNAAHAFWKHCFLKCWSICKEKQLSKTAFRHFITWCWDWNRLSQLLAISLTQRHGFFAGAIVKCKITQTACSFLTNLKNHISYS